MEAILPEDVTLNQVKTKHCLIVLFLMSVLTLKVLRPCNILEVHITHLHLYNGPVLSDSTATIATTTLPDD